MTNGQYQEPNDFSFDYSGTDLQNRELVDGKYAVTVKTVTRKEVRTGKHAGCPTLEWRMKISEGELTGLEFVATTMLAPENLKWTTDRIISAVFPAIQKGTNIGASDFIGKMLEVAIKTQPNEKTGKTSMFVNIDAATPYADQNLAGDANSFLHNEPDVDLKN